MSLARKWVEFESIVLYEINRIQKVNYHVLYEKQNIN